MSYKLQKIEENTIGMRNTKQTTNLLREAAKKNRYFFSGPATKLGKGLTTEKTNKIPF